MSLDKSEVLNNEASSYIKTLPSKNVEPLWTVMNAMVPPLPNPKASITSWKYNEIRPLLLEAGRLVSDKEAERRVLMLVNPTMKAPYTTDTIYAGLQLINPGETAPAHRHTAFALRFIIEGERGFTAVGGKKVVMRRGDVILTPSWEWHDHGHEGQGPMIWLDGLDLPLYQAFPVNFAELYQEDRYPSELGNADGTLRFGWDEVQEELDGQSGNHGLYRYSMDGSNKPLSRTMGGQAERIDAGTASPPIRESCSFVYHCYEGKGHSELRLPSGETEVVEWTQGDTFAAPAWTERVHIADSTCSSYLFAISDEPLLRNLGMYRREGETA